MLNLSKTKTLDDITKVVSKKKKKEYAMATYKEGR